MKRTPVIALAIKWINAIATIRTLTGATNPSEALPGSIRWDLGLTIDWNIIHASDSEETAQKELARFFGWEWVYDYTKLIDEVL
jgi:nucleoside-diphosphate kinase